MVATAARDVLINLKYVPDKGNASVLRQSGKEAVSIQAEISKAMQSSAAAQIKSIVSIREEIEKATKAWKDYAAAAGARFPGGGGGPAGPGGGGKLPSFGPDKKEWEKARREAEAAAKFDADFVRKGEQNAAKLAAARERESMRYWAGEARRIDKGIADEKRLQTQREAAFKQIGGGALQAAKGLATLGLVGEESTQKILQNLIKIQGAFDLAKGALQLSQGLRAAGAASGAAGGASGAASGIGGAIAGAGPLGLAVAGTVAALGLLTVAATMAADAENDLRKAKDKIRTDANRDMIEAAREDRETLESKTAVRRAGFNDLDELRSGGDATKANATAIARERQRLADAQAERSAIARRSGVGKSQFQSILDASDTSSNANEQARSLSEIVKLEQERLKLSREAGKSAVEAAQKQLELEKQSLQTVRQRLAAEESALQTAEEKFANLNPAEQAQAVAAANKAQRGGALSEADRKILEQSGLSDADETVKQGVREDNRKRIAAAGGDKFFNERRQRVDRLRDTETDLSEQVIDQEAAIEKIKEGAKEQADKLVEVVAAAIAARDAALINAINAKALQAEIEKRVQQSTIPAGS